MSKFLHFLDANGAETFLALAHIRSAQWVQAQTRGPDGQPVAVIGGKTVVCSDGQRPYIVSPHYAKSVWDKISAYAIECTASNVPSARAIIEGQRNG